MNRRKNKGANIIKKSRDRIHVCDIGNQPKLIKKKKEVKKKKPKNKDLFVKPGSRNVMKKNKNKKVKKMLEEAGMVNIHSNAYKRSQKMNGFRMNLRRM